MKGPAGGIYSPAKRSDTGYLGVRLSKPARDRIAAYGEQLRRAG